MNPQPISVVDAYKAITPGQKNGSTAPSAMPVAPMIIGKRAPARSVRRPEETASSIGRNPYKPVITPTAKVDSPR